MADIIRVKGKVSQTSIDNIQLKGRELLYDGDESVYIGTTTGEDAAKDKKKLYGKRLADLSEGLSEEIARAKAAEGASETNAKTYADTKVSSLKTGIQGGTVVAGKAADVTTSVGGREISEIFFNDTTIVLEAFVADHAKMSNSLYEGGTSNAIKLDGTELIMTEVSEQAPELGHTKKSNATVGNASTPVYLNSGKLTPCNLASSAPPVGSLWWGKEGDTPPYNGMADPATGSTVVWSEVGYTPLNIKGTVYKQNVAMTLVGTQDNQHGRITVPVDDTCFFKTFPSTTQLVAEVLTKEYILNQGTINLSLSNDSTKLTINVSNATKNPDAGPELAKMFFKISATSSSIRQVDLHCYWRVQ